jgi:predicted ATPase
VIDSRDGIFEVQMAYPGIARPLRAKELSDGTLRYLCLVAALITPSPPPLLALNEPETSLHPEMIAPLAVLIAKAADRSQIWITTHSRDLSSQLEELTCVKPRELEIEEGETRLSGKPTTSYFSAED